MTRFILYEALIYAVDNRLRVFTVINNVQTLVYDTHIIANEHLNERVTLKFLPGADNKVFLYGENTSQDPNIHHNPYHFNLDIVASEKIVQGTIITTKLIPTIDVTSHNQDAQAGTYLNPHIPIYVASNTVCVDDVSQL